MNGGTFRRMQQIGENNPGPGEEKRGMRHDQTDMTNTRLDNVTFSSTSSRELQRLRLQQTR